MAQVKSTTSSEHIFDVLRLITSAGHPIAAGEVSAQLGLSHTTTLRALLTLLEVKAIEKVYGVSGKYVPGVLTHELVDALFGRFAIRSECMNTLKSLAASTGETASLGVPAGWYAVRIAAIGGWKPNRIARVGKYTPLNASSGGRCILAFLPESFQRNYLATGPKSKLTANTPTDQADLCDRLAEISKRGYEIDIGGVFENVSSIAVPLMANDGKCVGSISLDGPSFNFDVGSPSMIKMLRNIAKQQEESLRTPSINLESPFADILPEIYNLP